MAELHALHCPGCNQKLPRPPDPDDYGDDERAYREDIDRRWELHDCPVLDKHGPARKDRPTRNRRGRPTKRKRGQPGRVRNYRFLCACEEPFKVRTGRRDLDATCNHCGGQFQWEPSESEHTGPIREGAA